MTAIGCLLMLSAIPARVLAEFFPGMLACSGLWGCLIVGSIALRNCWALPGMGCNAAAMLANGGVMPVYGSSDFTPSGLHVQGTPDMALQFLCDRFAGSSLGDMLLLGGLMSLGVWKFYRSRRPLEVQT